MNDTTTINNDANIERVVENILGGKKNIILDATILSTLMSCPRLSDFKFNMNLQSINGKSNSLECGSIVHKFLEVYYGSIINGIKKSDAVGFAHAAAQLYITGCKFCTGFSATEEKPKPECGHKIDDYPGVFNTPPDDEGYIIGWKRVLDTCQEYIDFWRNDHWVPLEVENVRGKILYEDDEIRIMWKAKLDAVFDTNQGIYPVDHKTMKQRRKSLKINNQFMGQCLIMGTNRMYKNEIGFQKTLKAEEKFTRPVMPYSSPVLIEWQSEILPYYGKLLLMYAETGYFPPNFTHCENKYGNCVFSGVCESTPDMREEELRIHFKVGPKWNPTNDEDE